MSKKEMKPETPINWDHSSPLEIIKALGAPADSYIQAIRYFNERARNGPPLPLEHEILVQKIIGLLDTPCFSSKEYARYVFLYTIQETIRSFAESAPDVPDMDEVYASVIKRVENLKQILPSAFKAPVVDSDDGPAAQSASTKKHTKRGNSKKVRGKILYEELVAAGKSREEMIAEFQAKLNMSKAGATVYIYNYSKGNWS
jgi:hypothetical protein